MPTTLPQADRRHRTAIVRSARIGGSLAKLVRQARRHVLDSLPATIFAHDLHGVRADVERTCAILARLAGERLEGLLLKAAEREHLLTAVAITRASGRVAEDVLDYLRLIIPAPAVDLLRRIVGPVSAYLTRLIDPQRASNVVLQGVAAGKTRVQIADDLETVFGGWESAARRVARTEGLRVATQTQLAVSEQSPDVVIGYELNTVLDERVRPEHRKRHGWRYYRNPKGNQRGLDQCPQPPMWDGKIAHNCRCFLIPIVDGDDAG